MPGDILLERCEGVGNCRLRQVRYRFPTEHGEEAAIIWEAVGSCQEGCICAIIRIRELQQRTADSTDWTPYQTVEEFFGTSMTDETREYWDEFHKPGDDQTLTRSRYRFTAACVRGGRAEEGEKKARKKPPPRRRLPRRR